tara:strand:- start:370 stop:774 length:405 start_codon:yes stop_codon:yes gene_type:complete
MKSKNISSTLRELFRNPQKIVSLFKNRNQEKYDTGHDTKENLENPTKSPAPSDNPEEMAVGIIILIIVIVVILLVAIIFVIVRLCRGQYKSTMLVLAVLFISPIPLIGSNGIGPLGCLILLFLSPNRPNGCIEK